MNVQSQLNMNRDDVIPPSPPVKVNKSRTRVKCSKSPRQRKSRRSILSLRTKILQIAKDDRGTSTNSNTNVNNAESKESTEKSTNGQVCDINIYAGIDDVSAEERNHTMSIMDNFDILCQPKFIEKCNQMDLSQSRNIVLIQSHSHPCGLISVKELLSSKNMASAESDTESTSSAQECVQSLSNSRIEREAKEVSFDNIQFSEWPIASDCVEEVQIDANDFNQHDFLIQQSSSERQLNLQIRNDSNKKESERYKSPDDANTVDAILNDFVYTSDEGIGKNLPLFLLRQRNTRTYKRKRINSVKTLLFDKSNKRSIDDELENDCDIKDTQCNQDIDLNSSRPIIENLTQLNTFFTQSHSFDLNFNTDLSHNVITHEEEFREFPYDSDDLQSTRIEDIGVDNDNDDDVGNISTPKNKKLTTGNDPSIHLLNAAYADVDDDFFLDINTPKLERAKKTLISTPMSKRCFEESTMNSTPSTSKQTIPNEHRIPKRLRFYPEIDHSPNNAPFSMNEFKSASSSKTTGFSTARGTNIQMSVAQVKRTAAIFADIDERYNEIDPILEQPSNPKKPKYSNEKDTLPISTNQFCAANQMVSKQMELNENQICNGFQKAGNGKTIDIATKNVLSLFGEDFSDLGFGKQNQLAPSFKPSNCAGTSTMTVTGFATAGGTSINVLSNNMEKYAQTLKEIDQNLCEGFDIKGVDNLVCKTPLNKVHRSKDFATSTPNLNSMTGFKNYPPITPINKDSANHDKNEHLKDLLEDDMIAAMFNTSTQQLRSDTTNVNNTSVSLNASISNDFQRLNDSITEKGIDVLKIDKHIKCKREQALCAQQAQCFKKPHQIRSRLGSLLVQKILCTKKLHELGTPKKYSRNELERFGVQSKIIELSVDNALQFKFDMWKFYSDEVCRTNVDGIDMEDDICLIMDGNSRVGVKELTSAFLNCPTVDPKLVPDHWIENGLKWIILKLASYERSYPHEFSGKCLTPENVSEKKNMF